MLWFYLYFAELVVVLNGVYLVLRLQLQNFIMTQTVEKKTTTFESQNESCSLQ